MSKNFDVYNILIEILTDAKGAHDGVKKPNDDTTCLRGIFNLYQHMVQAKVITIVNVLG
jgi:hypothetical protein